MPKQMKCAEEMCNERGSCFKYFSGELIESFECICDLWYTGQRCELMLSYPIVTATINFLIVTAVCTFLWFSWLRFRNKFTYVPACRTRFVDFLHQKQKNEKKELEEINGQNAREQVVEKKKKKKLPVKKEATNIEQSEKRDEARAKRTSAEKTAKTSRTTEEQSSQADTSR